MHTRNTFLAVLLTVLALPAWSAAYIKFDGIDGESRSKDHKGWIDVTSVSQGATNRDAASGLATGKRQHKPVTITKPVDKASPLLYKAFREGRPLQNVEIEVDGQVTVMKSATIQSIDKDAAGNEVITLTPAPAAARKKGNVETEWKVEEGTK